MYEAIKLPHDESKCINCGHDVSNHTKNPRFILTCFHIEDGKTCACTKKFF